MLSTSLDSSLHHQEDHWIPLSDLMTALMMFFLLLAISYMVKAEATNEQIKQIAVHYKQIRAELYMDLAQEFEKDLDKWGAELDLDLTIRFKEPDILFDTGSSELKHKFKLILNDFFPRYVSILNLDKYKSSIQDIRIEGHTSSLWNNNNSMDDAYYLNMELSQTRTRSTLQYILSLSEIQNQKIWLKSLLTANGLASSKLIVDKNGVENLALSRRVEFKVKTDAELKLADILKVIK
jgi:outer membrane protein OmpA-like peptidoglycan-associated protein